MARHNELGLAGEEEACRYLMHRGYRLLDRNWRVGHLELDIVADYYGEIVFVEVKTRSSQKIEDFEEEQSGKTGEHSRSSPPLYIGQTS